MILSIGTDLAEVERIRKAHLRFDERFLQRIYTPVEITYCFRKANPYERLAGRFAAKEAAMKAIGTGLAGGVSWQDFEVANMPSGKPTLTFKGAAAEHAARLGVAVVHLSMTHTTSLAMAVVILES